MGFKPLAFGLLAGDKPADALKNAIGDTTVAGKLYYDEEEKRKKEDALAARQAAAAKQPGAEGMKRGGKVVSASKRGDGIAARGKTRGRMV
jgi:hypothetical protein